MRSLVPRVGRRKVLMGGRRREEKGGGAEAPALLARLLGRPVAVGRSAPPPPSSSYSSSSWVRSALGMVKRGRPRPRPLSPPRRRPLAVANGRNRARRRRKKSDGRKNESESASWQGKRRRRRRGRRRQLSFAGKEHVVVIQGTMLPKSDTCGHHGRPVNDAALFASFCSKRRVESRKKWGELITSRIHRKMVKTLGTGFHCPRPHERATERERKRDIGQHAPALLRRFLRHLQREAARARQVLKRPRFPFCAEGRMNILSRSGGCF